MEHSKITVRLYRPEAGFVTVALPDGKAPRVGSEMMVAGCKWKVTMVEYPISGRLEPGVFLTPDGLTWHADGSNVVDVKDNDGREDSP